VKGGEGVYTPGGRRTEWKGAKSTVRSMEETKKMLGYSKLGKKNANSRNKKCDSP
jgi:hypothetical protein